MIQLPSKELHAKEKGVLTALQLRIDSETTFVKKAAKAKSL
jgi:hypothetical protein